MSEKVLRRSRDITFVLLGAAVSSLGTILALEPTATVTSSYNIIGVTDGDTLVLEAKFLPEELGSKLGLRIVGIDAPEKGGRAECESEAKKAELAHTFTEKSIKEAKSIDISLLGWDKFGGRVIGEVFVDGKSLGKLLIEKNLARPYDGNSPKQSWCEEK